MEDIEISPHLFSEEWRDDIEEALLYIEEVIESKDFKEPFHGWSSLCFSTKKILSFKLCTSPKTGSWEDKICLMTIFEDIWDISGYSGKSFKISQEAKEYIEKNIIPNLTPNFANLAPDLSVMYFVKILAEKAKEYFKKDIEEKSYIDRE